MKKLVVLLLASLVASVAFAGIDDGTDSFGVYFDTAGNSNALPSQPIFTPFNVYLLLMNPAGQADGFECTVTVSGAPFFRLAETFPVSTIDVDASVWGYAAGAAAAYPTSSGAMLLCTWQMMVQAGTPLEFRIGPAAQPSLTGGLPVVTGNGVLRRCGVASGSVTAPVAYVNSPMVPIATETSSFGSVKGLFR